MRRKEREIQDFDEIVEALRRADTIRLGLNGPEYPYVVPLSFGFEVADGKIAVYIHGAKEGLKHDLMARDNRVCVEADTCERFVDLGNDVTTAYESVIGFGEIEKLTSEADMRKGLDLILEHCGFPGYPYEAGVLKVLTVHRIVLSRVTGKRNKQ